MERRRVQWMAILLPAALVGSYEYLRHRWLEQLFPPPVGNLVGAALVALAIYGFIHYFMVTFTRTEQELGRSRAEAAVLAERHRIGREMHDSVAQTLFHLRVKLRTLADTAPEPTRSEAERLRGLVDNAYGQVREAITGLKRGPDPEDPMEAVVRACQATAAAQGLKLHLAIAGLPPLGAHALPHLTAILTEAITNAHRHGRATSVSITADSKHLAIVDDGVGFVPDRPSEGFGIPIMAERAKVLGAELRIRSAPDGGATVMVAWEDNSRALTDPDRG